MPTHWLTLFRFGYKMKKETTIKGNKGEIVLYRAQGGRTELSVHLEAETLWLTQKQMAELFETERSVITKHIRNIFKTSELKEGSVCAKFAHTATDGKTYQTAFYNLDVIISVGYRVNSVRGTQFRIWATNILKDHLDKGLPYPFFACPKKGYPQERTPSHRDPACGGISLAARFQTANRQTRPDGLRHVDPCFRLKSLHSATLRWGGRKIMLTNAVTPA
jgi:hypothetical protein